MTAEEKAIELVEKFSQFMTTWDCYNDEPRFDEDIIADAKQCALIAVDEVINIAYWAFMESGGKQEQEFWQEVKIEIEKL